jgi:hypothetical protein
MLAGASRMMRRREPTSYKLMTKCDAMVEMGKYHGPDDGILSVAVSLGPVMLDRFNGRVLTKPDMNTYIDDNKHAENERPHLRHRAGCNVRPWCNRRQGGRIKWEI